MRRAAVAAAVAALMAVGLAAQSRGKVDIVRVAGCLEERDGGRWLVTSATDPVASDANAPPKTEIPTTPPNGKNTFELIGVSEFNLPKFKGQIVVVKGLFIKAEPVSRVNITAVVSALPGCAVGRAWHALESGEELS
jgi:hypothetical protein